MNEEKQNRLKALWMAGAASEKIGEELGCSGAHVRSIAITLRLPSRLITDRRTALCRELGVGAVNEIPEYGSWVEMRRRAQRTREDHPTYAAMQLTVDPRWEDFTNFYRDMGPRPTDGHSVDRKDNKKGYEPSNCRWATAMEQANNRSSNRIVNYRGTDMSLAQAVREAGSKITRGGARMRLERGWDVALAVETPPTK